MAARCLRDRCTVRDHLSAIGALKPVSGCFCEQRTAKWTLEPGSVSDRNSWAAGSIAGAGQPKSAFRAATPGKVRYCRPLSVTSWWVLPVWAIPVCWLHRLQSLAILQRIAEAVSGGEQRNATNQSVLVRRPVINIICQLKIIRLLPLGAYQS